MTKRRFAKKWVVVVLMALVALLPMTIRAQAPTILYVTTTADSGEGSLREAIINANAQPNSTILFAIDAPQPHIIQPLSPLPPITAPVQLIGNEACGEAESAGMVAPTVAIDGARIGTGDGLYLAQSASDAHIVGLAIYGFAGGAGIFVEDTRGVQVYCTYIGMAMDGRTARPNSVGVYATEASLIIVIGDEGRGNLISGNSTYGVRFLGRMSSIRHNYIGINANGTLAVPNGASGIALEDGSGMSVVGNVVSGNGEMGILITNSTDALLLSNYVGTTGEGANAIPNRLSGIFVRDSSQIQIGGPAQGNVVSGNTEMGIVLRTTTQASLYGNFIGTNPSGDYAIPNGFSGVGLSLGTQETTIGGQLGALSNVISGNAQIGIRISDEGTTRTTITGNFIGTNATGSAALPNGFSGIFIRAGASETLVGNGFATDSNIISGNGQSGVVIFNASGNVITGNYIGTDATGTYAIPNTYSGISMEDGAFDNLIGGFLEGDGNLISGNAELGIYISGNRTRDNRVLGNFIGTDISGSYAIPNGYSGIGVFDGASNTLIGDPTPEARNVVSGNGQFGVAVSGGRGVIIENNYIGTDVTGTLPIPNGFGGVMVEAGGRDVKIGGDAPEFRNVISGNSFSGVGVRDAGSGNVIIIGNFIGSDVSGQKPLGNAVNGVRLTEAADTIFVGGDGRGEGNLIAHNGSHGVLVSAVVDVTVTGNAILTNNGAGAYLPDGNAETVMGRNDLKNNCRQPVPAFVAVCQDLVNELVP